MRELTVIENVKGYADQDGTVWLSLEDVAMGLGFTQEKNGVMYVRWETVSRYLNDYGFSQLVGKETFIPENVFYLLAMKANNDTALSFQMRVANEILPAIRKHGGYLTPAKIEEVLSDPDTIIKLATTLKEERQRRLQLEAEKEQNAPLVAFAETCCTSEDSLLIREVAKLASKHGVVIGEKRLYLKLREWRMIRPGCTEPYQEYIDRGYFEVVQNVKETSSGTMLFRTTRVTPKGQVYIINRLRKEVA
jgi:anti-repressor protein